MKAAVFSRYGGSEVVEIRDIPAPVPGPGEVLVGVRAADALAASEGGRTRGKIVVTV